MSSIVILTGAGLSAESGLGTFRDVGGIWSQYDLSDVATPEAYARDPALVHQFYNARRANAAGASPNAGHRALARLEKEWRGQVLIVTQNVDDLHERAGSTALLHLHGELARARCTACAHEWPAPAEMSPQTLCPACKSASARPDIVWFGEMPFHMERVMDALSGCNLFVSIGTSGSVYPAAGFVQIAAAAGADTLELNLERSDVATDFARAQQGPATEIVPEWVNSMLLSQT